MAEITVERVGELIRSLFELLWYKPDGLLTKEIFPLIPEITALTEFESGRSQTNNLLRFERIIRLATIPLERAGWLIKNNKGRWYIADDGRQACRKFPNAEELYKEALRRLADGKQNNPESIMTMEIAEEKAWEQIEKYLQSKNPSELKAMMSHLIRALGYHVSWIAPPEKKYGQVDIVAWGDPIGAKEPRIIIQIKHKGQAMTLEGLKSFHSILGQNDFGLIFSTGGLTNEGKEALITDDYRKVTFWDLDSFVDLWIINYPNLKQEAQNMFPLKAIYFLSLNE